jgi:hypothetical protein
MEPDSKTVDVEVVPDNAVRSPLSAPAVDGNAHERRSVGPPVHPLAALLLLVVDNLWLLPEFLGISWAVTIPLCFITMLVPAFLIQKLLKQQRLGAAFGYALLLALVAAVPMSLLGTPVGAAMLAWFGISRLWGGSHDRARP